MSYLMSEKYLINTYQTQDFASRNTSVPNVMVYFITITKAVN